jgi:hypothetical protein
MSRSHCNFSSVGVEVVTVKWLAFSICGSGGQLDLSSFEVKVNVDVLEGTLLIIIIIFNRLREHTFEVTALESLHNDSEFLFDKHFVQHIILSSLEIIKGSPILVDFGLFGDDLFDLLFNLLLQNTFEFSLIDTLLELLLNI